MYFPMNLSLRFLIAAGVCFLIGSGSLLAHDPHDPIVTVAVSPNFAQDQTVFASTDLLSIKFGVYALMKSTDAGATWSALGGLPRNTRMQTIAFSPAYAADQTIFVASLQGLFRTTNQGTSWTMQLKNPLASLVLS